MSKSDYSKYIKIRDSIEKLEENIFSDVQAVDKLLTSEGIKVKQVPYNSRETVLEDSSEWESFEYGSTWGKPDTHYCFHLQITIPEIYKGKEVLFFLSTGAEDIWNTDNPQMLVYINGQRRCGMDMNHNSVTIFEKDDWAKDSDRHVDIRIYAYSNLAADENLFTMTIAARNEAVQQLYFDMIVPFEAAQAMLLIKPPKTESVLDTTAGAEKVQDEADSSEEEAQDKTDQTAEENIEENTENITEEAFERALESENGRALDLIIEGLYSACQKIEPEKSDSAAATNGASDDKQIAWQPAADSEMKVSDETDRFRAASEYLRINLYGQGQSLAMVKSVGHTHIDVAWKWRLRQTREKVIRSYSTVMELMKRYPEYLFMASTPQMYEFVNEDEPELFDEIKERVSEGRFEPEGAMWIESDCNLTSGESLVRQIMYGKEYFRETFDKESRILWLPDAFGYNAAMPQILKKSGIDFFVTTKLAWNDTNRLPNDLFMWEGIDGSGIPAYMVTTCDYIGADKAMNEGGILNYTYNGRQNASQIMGTWRAFREKNITNNVLTCYGYGDGGGGPTWEMLEMDRRFAMGIPGVPKTEQITVTDFFNDLRDKIKDGKNLPIWSDELYLEYHRGTFTSIGQNKKNNRNAEYLMAETELLSVYAYLCKKADYPREKIKDIWKLILLNQFHDILPGSSIEGVYDDSDDHYDRIQRSARKLIDAAWEAVSDSYEKTKGYVALQEKPSESAEEEDDPADIAENASVSINPGKKEINVSTKYFDIIFDENIEISGLYDKEAECALSEDDSHPLNRLIAFEDKPKEYDSWNIDADFENVSWDLTDWGMLTVYVAQSDEDVLHKIFEKDRNAANTENAEQAAETEIVSRSAYKIVVAVSRRFRDSTIEQRIVIKNDSRRIDFNTRIYWHEHQVLLKTAFPVYVQTDEITAEIPFGSIKRSLKRETSREQAKFECCMHKWIDMSDAEGTWGRHGVALLNDCKYGYDAKENLMRLSLIKSGIYPNPNADQGIHEFTYSLFPHLGDYRESGVIEEARALNEVHHYYLPEGCENISDISRRIIDLGSERGVFIEAIKLAEQDNDVIIRLYEGYGQEHAVKASLYKGIDAVPQSVTECDLLENDLGGDDITYYRSNKEAVFTMKPYEIKTIRIRK